MDLPFIIIPFIRLVPLRNISYYLEYDSTTDLIKTHNLYFKMNRK